MLQELELPGLTKIVIYCDNSNPKFVAENPVFHSRIKHIDVRHHYTRQAVKDGIVSLRSISTAEMPADVLRKSLPKPKHGKIIESLGAKKSK